MDSLSVFSWGIPISSTPNLSTPNLSTVPHFISTPLNGPVSDITSSDITFTLKRARDRAKGLGVRARLGLGDSLHTLI